MTKPAPWKGCLGCLGIVVLVVIVFFCLLLEPQLLFGSRTRFMAHWDHQINLPESAQILNRKSLGGIMDRHIITVLLVPNSEVPAIRAQVKPSDKIVEGNEVTIIKRELLYFFSISVRPEQPGISRLTLTTVLD
jgi:hypothetical protein